jgi:hypothetical protein
VLSAQSFDYALYPPLTPDLYISTPPATVWFPTWQIAHGAGTRVPWQSPKLDPEGAHHPKSCERSSVYRCRVTTKVTGSSPTCPIRYRSTTRILRGLPLAPFPPPRRRPYARDGYKLFRIPEYGRHRTLAAESARPCAMSLYASDARA